MSGVIGSIEDLIPAAWAGAWGATLVLGYYSYAAGASPSPARVGTAVAGAVTTGYILNTMNSSYIMIVAGSALGAYAAVYLSGN